MRQYEDRLGLNAGRLDALSPLLQLDRGYVIASRERGRAGLVSAADLMPGDRLWLRFSRGQAKTRILRQLVQLLDDAIPIVHGSEIHDQLDISVIDGFEYLFFEPG